ncbi:hypothetical protein M2480_002922 [Parabacteroides sp. PFB2-12]|uniref:relaxase/mobilization nuclease domain-containing protein n=1 Tax=unclassified Parabacteroides TaxID=2649774 RepID=UPI002474E5AB|nr:MULTISPECIES: relaxase/mobilization nuclease domain-containing protein [unclassified Parabacteroides]MDH6343757.1 hypothetical protein [Parabacteroides sp. PM6-13]MDH6391919.1 hypothetical protein [Parabacteroides sp. PFB2-12]
MIAKITTGNNFNGVVKYIIDTNKQAEIIDSVGVRLKDINSIISSFTTQQGLSPGISKPVYHISLDFSSKDTDELTNERMSEIARDYLERMGIRNTQFIAVRHYDKNHPHIHLCINRIDNDGNLISTKNDRYKSEKVCKAITREYELYFSSGKEKVNRHRLKGADKAKYEINDAIKSVLEHCCSWKEFIQQLEQQGIKTQFKFKGQSSTIEGVSFSKDGFSFSGSKIDRQFSFSKLDQAIQNQRLADHDSQLYFNGRKTTVQQSYSCDERVPPKQNYTHSIMHAGYGISGGGGSDDDPNKKKRKRHF